MKRIGQLCIITDMSVQNKFSHTELAEMAAKGGADMIQFREKNMTTAELIDTAIAIRRICKKFNITFIINDKSDVALASNADGVHLGKNDISVSDARKLLGKKRIIGSTAHSLKEALKAERDGADYIGFGHIFHTESKQKYTVPKGINELRRVCTSVKIPVIAIGGINASNVKQVIDAGAYGFAVIGAVVKSEDPHLIVKKLKRLIT